jgi:hypothetical protein
MSDIRARFDALGEWYTRYEIAGEVVGGENSYADDYRTELFFSWFGRPRTILELGSFEGGHSLTLAGPPFVERLLGLEGRAENIARSTLAVDLLGRGNVEFQQADLDADGALAGLDRFDAVFCAGLLYHLANPSRLLGAIGGLTDRLFLDTHYATEELDVDGRLGSWFHELGPEHPLSGLTAESAWLTLPSLICAVNDAGFAVRHLVDVPDWAGNGRRAHLGCVRASTALD